MKIRLFSQYAGESALYTEFNKLLKTANLFRVLVAYVSMGGLKIIESEFISFLHKKCFADWIIGIDNGITSKDVLRYLLFLRKKYSKYLRIRIFTAGNNNDLFHPKVYMISNSEIYDIFIGSNNLTAGGLMGNFESSAHFNLSVKDERERKFIHGFESMWQQYSTPAPPLTKDNIIELDEELIESINDDSVKERNEIQNSLKKYEHPFSSVDKHDKIAENIRKLHHNIQRKRKGKSVSKKQRVTKQKIKESNQLIMDILQETRETQVQIPTEVLKPFFRIEDLTIKKEITLSQKLNGNIIKTDIRPFIIQSNKTNRLEISGIKGLPRPLIIKFQKIDEDVYEYELIANSSSDYESLNKLLSESGFRKRKDSRRWILIS